MICTDTDGDGNLKINYKDAWDKTKYTSLVLITLIISGSAIANIFPLTTPCRLILAVLFVLPFINSIVHEHGSVIIYFALFGTMFMLSLIANPYNYKYILTVSFYIVVSYSKSNTNTK